MSNTIAASNARLIATFGDLLRHLRQGRGQTQEELGLAVGYSRAHVARLESGQRLPEVEVVRIRFTEALGLPAQSEMARRLIALAEAAHGGSATQAAQPLPNNLPFALTRFIGHERALVELARLLTSARLITLTGTGGTGKTRLAQELAGRIVHNSDSAGWLEDGVWLIELDHLTDPQGVPIAALTALGLSGPRSEAPVDLLVRHVSAKHMLLILDNCEHLLDASAHLVERVLRHSPGLRVLATSREPLCIEGELVWRVPSLTTPDLSRPLTPAQLHRFDAVQLFADRAALATPTFALTADNAPAVQQICARLDGIPLALELAAARMRTLTPQEIARNLDDRFHLLTNGNRTAVPRHQTMRAEIDWSYNLLTDPDRRCLRHLAVFVGSWTRAAAAAVCDNADRSRLDSAVDSDSTLTRLQEKSLVIEIKNGATRRFRLLETIRQYATEKLVAAGELPAARERHLAYYGALGHAERRLLGGDVLGNEAEALRELEHDLGNFRQAVDWANESGRIADGLQLINDVIGLYIQRTGQRDAIEIIRSLLRHPAAAHNTLVEAEACLNMLDLLLRRNNLPEAEAAVELAESINATLNDARVQAWILRHRAVIALFHGDYALAHAYRDKWRALAIDKHLHDPMTLSSIDSAAVAWFALLEGDAQQAKTAYRQVYIWEKQLQHGLASTSAIARHLAYALISSGEYGAAGRYLRESLLDNRTLGDRQGVAACVSATAGLAQAHGDLQRAAQLFGAAAAMQQALNTQVMTTDAILAERSLNVLRKKLPQPEFDAAWSAGMQIDEHGAVDLALQIAVAAAGPDADAVT
jgi:predicted ATPase/DNA-binding XRE family transcriptional regulator